jgi:hypothetical protein
VLEDSSLHNVAVLVRPAEEFLVDVRVSAYQTATACISIQACAIGKPGFIVGVRGGGAVKHNAAMCFCFTSCVLLLNVLSTLERGLNDQP